MTMGRLLHPWIVRGITLWALGLGIPPSGAQAMPTRTLDVVQPINVREAQIQQVMSAMAQPAAQLHLRAMGISPAELRTGLERLDDAQLASVANQAESVKAGGLLGLIIGLLIVAILVVVLLALMDKEVEVTDKD